MKNPFSCQLRGFRLARETPQQKHPLVTDNRQLTTDNYKKNGSLSLGRQEIWET